MIAVVLLAVSAPACSDNDDDIVVLSLDPAPTESAPSDQDLSETSAAPDADQEAEDSSFVTEAVAGANEAEQRYVPTQTPTLIPRRTTPSAAQTALPSAAQTAPPSAAQTAPPSAAQTAPTAQPVATTQPATPQSATPQPDRTKSGVSETNTPQPWPTEAEPAATQPPQRTERPAACSEGFERVYEAFATDSPPIGIAICVAPDGRAEYLGLDVKTNNRIRLSACVDGTNFVANNGGSLYVIDIGNDVIRYPQAPAGRHLDSVTMITSAATIPALGC